MKTKLLSTVMVVSMASTAVQALELGGYKGKQPSNDAATAMIKPFETQYTYFARGGNGFGDVTQYTDDLQASSNSNESSYGGNDVSSYIWPTGKRSRPSQRVVSDEIVSSRFGEGGFIRASGTVEGHYGDYVSSATSEMDKAVITAMQSKTTVILNEKQKLTFGIDAQTDRLAKCNSFVSVNGNIIKEGRNPNHLSISLTKTFPVGEFEIKTGVTCSEKNIAMPTETVRRFTSGSALGLTSQLGSKKITETFKRLEAFVLSENGNYLPLHEDENTKVAFAPTQSVATGNVVHAEMRQSGSLSESLVSYNFADPLSLLPSTETDGSDLDNFGKILKFYFVPQEAGEYEFNLQTFSNFLDKKINVYGSDVAIIESPQHLLLFHPSLAITVSSEAQAPKMLSIPPHRVYSLLRNTGMPFTVTEENVGKKHLIEIAGGYVAKKQNTYGPSTTNGFPYIVDARNIAKEGNATLEEVLNGSAGIATMPANKLIEAGGLPEMTVQFTLRPPNSDHFRYLQADEFVSLQGEATKTVGGAKSAATVEDDDDTSWLNGN